MHLAKTSFTPKYNVEYKELFRMFRRIRRNEKPRTDFWIHTNARELASIGKYAIIPMWLKNDKL